MLSSSLEYPISFVSAAFEPLRAHLLRQNYSSIFVLVDNHTQQHCLPILEAALQGFSLIIIAIEAGEQHKNLQTCQSIWSALMQGQADRKSVLLNLGGGVIGDMGGFCASTFKRGMDFIQLPTTLLAQVDASVGGKLGIDFEQIKNGIGLFGSPQAVFMFTGFLGTLPLMEIKSGFAEMLKHGLIDNLAHWQNLLLVSDWTAVQWQPLIEQSLQVKKQIVLQDPFEKNIRKSLNFGHTIGHVLESLSWQTAQPLLHGHAIAIGLIIECYWSTKLLELPTATLVAVRDYILSIYGKYDLTQLDLKAVDSLILQDKKNENQIIKATLLAKIGQARINVAIPQTLIKEGLDYYINLK